MVAEGSPVKTAPTSDGTGPVPNRRLPFSLSLAVIAPGLLVAATGVGAGDLLTAGLAGSAVGLSILWAAVAGAVLKWFLNEGIARWQMATGTTLLQGWVSHLGRWIRWLFLGYLLIWSVFTGGALVNACGVAGTSAWDITGTPRTSKIVWGILHSMVGLALVWRGGFRFFERLMAVCVAMMFVAVISTAFFSNPDWSAVARGLVTPRIPDGAMGWVLGVLGGVGGTVTLLSYGYWIREQGRSGVSGMRTCRIDLAVAYSMTALFGVCMIIIGSSVDIHRGGGLALVAVDLGHQLSQAIGPAGKWIFLVGFWGAVFSSLLGVWQSVPYMFADFVRLRSPGATEPAQRIDLRNTRAYRVYLIGIAIVPLPLLALSVKQAQLAYAILGSLFMPLLAVTLLMMNNRTDWVTTRFRNRWLTNVALVATLAFFAYVAGRTAYAKIFGW